MAVKTVVFNGETYIRNEKSRYYFKHTTKNSERVGAKQLHRAVWEYYNGEIPDGYHIHHIDHDVDNNDISNLECIPASQHLSMHGKENFDDSEYRRKNLEQLKDAQEKAKEWHSSEAGLEWHRKHAAESIAKAWVKSERTCEECGKTFIGTSRARFCSELCGQHFRLRTAGKAVKDRNRVCAFCGEQFVANNGIQKYCSENCRKEAAKLRARERVQQKVRPRNTKSVICLETGKTYESLKEASIDTGARISAISSVCHGVYKTANGYHFSFKNE